MAKREPKVDYSGAAIPKPGPKVRTSKVPKPRTPMKRYNPERVEERKEVTDGPQSDACRMLPCAVCGRVGKSVPHHVVPKARGGTDFDTIPMCDFTKLGVDGCHQEHNRKGWKTFWAEKGMDPEDIILGVQSWLQAGCPMGELPW